MVQTPTESSTKSKLADGPQGSIKEKETPTSRATIEKAYTSCEVVRAEEVAISTEKHSGAEKRIGEETRDIVFAG
jgi:hypothetical protein